MTHPATQSKNIFTKIKAFFVKSKLENDLDWNARVAKRAHELYELRGGQDGQADQDWFQAEREIKERLFNNKE